MYEILEPVYCVLKLEHRKVITDYWHQRKRDDRLASKRKIFEVEAVIRGLGRRPGPILSVWTPERVPPRSSNCRLISVRRRV